MSAARLSGLRGETGELTGLEMLELTGKLGRSGTLVLEGGEGAPGSLYALFEGGILGVSHSLGQDLLESAHLNFHFETHPTGDVPLFKSYFPSSVLSVLRAVPAHGTFHRLQTRESDLRALLDHLRERAYTGCLTLTTRLGQSLVLLHRGGVGAAFFEEDGYVREGTDALRALRRAYLESPTSALTLRSFAPEITQSLLGMALGKISRSGVGFSGVESSEQGYTFFEEGTPFLQVQGELRGSSARYLRLDETLNLSLPDEPPGWEQQRYNLTLRGQDALNPMTDLALQFRQSFAGPSKRVLEHLGKGLSVEAVSQYLGLELSDLKPHLEALEEDGLIRQR